MDPATFAQMSESFEESYRNPDRTTRMQAFAQGMQLLRHINEQGGPLAPWESPNRRRTGGASRVPYQIPPNPYQLDQVHPPDGSDFIVPLMAPSRILVVPGLETLSIAPGATSPGERLEFSAGGGWLIGMRGSAIDHTAGTLAAGDYEMATLGVRLFMNDGEELITNGTSSDFVRFRDLFPDATQWTPIMRRVDVKDVLNLNFQNFQPVATGHSLSPSFAFAFWREKYPGTG